MKIQIMILIKMYNGNIRMKKFKIENVYKVWGKRKTDFIKNLFSNNPSLIY